MNFFRKTFPLSQNKSLAQDTNVNNNISSYSEVSIDPYLSQIDNILESYHENAQLIDSSVTNTIFNDDIDSDNILCTLENVAPIKITLSSDTPKKPEEIVTYDVNSENGTIVNEITYNTEVSIVKTETFHNLNNINDELIKIEAVNDVVSQEAEVFNGSTIKNDVDDETLQNLRDFEETLNNFSKTASITDNSGDLINLDEFYESLDKLETIYEETSSQNGSVKSTIEHDRKSAIDSNKVYKTSEDVVNSERNPLENIDIILVNSSTEDEKSQTNYLPSNFSNTVCLSDDSGGVLMNFDEVYESLDKLETIYEETDSQNGSVKSTIEHDRESTINSNKVYETSEDVVNSERNPLENIDIISVNSSNEDEKSQINYLQVPIFTNSCYGEQNSECEGYNSSDFEFISEAEANMDGVIINFRRENYNFFSQANSHLSTFTGQIKDEFEGQVKEKDNSDPGEGPSGLNRPKNEFADRSYRDNHVVPVGNDYLGLFQGIYNPSLPLCEIYFMENKSVRASAMNIQYDGIGFDKQLAMKRHQPDSSEDEFEDDAKESAQKILNMYPRQNRKRRRRH